MALVTGLTVAVALVVAIPLYANAVGYRLLVEQLSQDATRPPFAFLFRYLGAWHGAVDWEAIQAADAYLTTHVATDLDLPAQSLVRHVRTEKWQLYPSLADDAAYDDASTPLAWLALGFLDDVEAHIDVVEGEPLTRTSAGVSPALPVLASRPLADQLGLHVGETYLLADPATPQSPLPLHIAGIWTPRDLDPVYWLYLPRSFDEVLLTTETIFRERVAPATDNEVGLAAWYLVADGQNVTGAAVGRLQDRIVAVRAKLDGLLPSLALDHSPESALQTYREETARLTLLLYAFGTPILGLELAFVGLVAGMTVQRQQMEIVVLRSRGASRRNVVGLYAGQWGLLGLFALLGGGPLGALAAYAMVQSRSFLQFAPWQATHIRLDARSWCYGLVAVALALLASIFPARRAARYTVVTHRQRTDATRHPWWQRYVLDGLLLIPALYGYTLLRRPSRLPLARLTQGDLFNNPLLFLAPTLFILAWALVLLRLFPLVMAVLARMSRRLRAAVPLLICHDLSEQVQRVAGPLLLLTWTTALATFSASLALTLDTHLVDRTYYHVGADVRLVEQGESAQQGPNAEPGATSEDEVEWVFLPIAVHRDLPGVHGATRVGDYNATATLGGKVEMGRYLGIDRLDLPGVTFFRDDFASASLGVLMNAMAAERRGVLVERRFLARHDLHVGDPLLLTVDVLGERVELTLIIVGALDYFPTLYPEDGPFFVGNLGYLFTRIGGLYPYDVWLATEPGNTSGIVAALNARGVPIVTAWDARARILEAQRQPQRQGLFGLLTLGFLVASLLTVAGLALHALLAFRERTVELGVLRAIGFSVGQMRRYLAGTQVTLLALGLIAGTVLGVLTGQLFVPFLQADAGLHPNTPPFIPRTAWTEVGLVYALFTVTALFTIGTTLFALRRMRLHEAIKLGETV